MYDLIRHLENNIAETLFVVAAVGFGYSIARLLNVGRPYALAFGFTPVLALWAFNNAATRQFVLAQFL